MQLLLSIRRSRKETAIPVDRSLLRRFAPILTLILVMIWWQAITLFQLIPAFLVPPPIEVARQFIEVIENGLLLRHTWVTLQEVLVGLTLGVSFALFLGYLIAESPLLEDFLSPLIVALQSTPVVAYAPLLIIWFGSGMTSKVITCALIVFFPMLMNTIVGIRSVPRNLRDLMRVLQANRWQTFLKLEIPSALPVLLTGLKTSATLAVVGAVVGEFINASAGLGFLINLARNQFDTPLVFVGVISLAVMARVLYGIVAVLERRLLIWKKF
ncbi:MAG: ABC transporter permease [Anaerolineae bacterium]|jgi:NitT/TauT family transport system permease protein|nr:ABC transporter permease [Anaerolineae bacterium]